MEANTIGKFITALRKASGMTQKELAEKLNVSDKTVSRWERDEGTPDLSLIPVLAEIFGVTCDDLLRGERRSAAQQPEEPDDLSPKGEKQRQRLLNTSLTRYRNQCFLAMGLAIAGLMGAMICNLGFLRAYIGFFVGCIFYVAAAVCQAVFINNAFLQVADADLSGEDINRFRLAVIRMAKGVYGMIFVLFAAVLPLMVYTGDAYWGLEADSWLGLGILYSAAALLVWGLVCHVLNGQLLKRGIYTLPEAKALAFWQNRRLKRHYALILVLLFAITGLAQILVNARWNAWDLAETIDFADYESFIEFMAQESGTVNPSVQEHLGGEPAMAPNEAVIWYDAYGNQITEEEALREELRVYDGTPEGKLVCTYIHRNRDVISVRPAENEDGLPIGVVTMDAMRRASRINTSLNLAFVPVYLLELAGVIFFYRKKRMI